MMTIVRPGVKKFSKLRFLVVFPLALGALSGCQAIEGLSSDFDNTLNTKHANAGREMITAEGGINMTTTPCPTVQIVDELSSLSEFSPANRQNTSNLVSRVDLSQVNSTCRIQDRLVTVDLKLAFDSTLGAKGKTNSSDKPFFSYPFFIAVTDQEGYVLAKEVFAASMTYLRKEDNHTYYEKLRQLIPIKSRDQAARFKIMIGFQLDQDQLQYNRKHMRPVQNTDPALVQDLTQSPMGAEIKPDYSGIKAEIQREQLKEPRSGDAPIRVVPQGM